MKWQLFVYDWSGRNEKKWINKRFVRMGEAPVILDTTLVTAVGRRVETLLHQ